MPEVRLQNVRAPGREAGGAISEVISPHAAESLVETELGDLIGDGIEAAQPGFQGAGIIQPETVELGDLESRLSALFAQTGRRQQHAAGEDVGLDEVRMAGGAAGKIVGEHERPWPRRAPPRRVTL